MRAVKRALVACTVVAWVLIAFQPRDRISAGPAVEVPDALAFATHAETVYSSDELAVPTDIEVVGEYLVLVDRRADQPIHILRPASRELIRSLGGEGDGPGEYRALRSVTPVPGSGTEFWAYDIAKARLTHIDLADEETLARPWEAELLTLETPARVTGIEWAADNSVIAAGFFDAGRLGLFASDGKMLGAVGDLPAHAEQETPATVLQHAYMGTLKAHPDRSQLVIALRHASWIEIRDADGALITRTDLPIESFGPKFDVADTEKGPMMRSDETLRFGYIDVAVTSEHIYGLYSGRTRAGNRGSANFGDQIHVFDWSGTLADVIEVQRDLIAIAVDADAGTLYGVSHDPAPMVLSWAMRPDMMFASR